MRRKYMWMGIAGLVLVLGISVVHAQGRRGRRHQPAGPRFEALDLSQEQKDQLKSLRSDGQKEMIQLRADMQVAKIELRELLGQKNPSQSKVDKTVASVTATQTKMTANRVQHKLAMNKILTEEQLKKLEKMPKGRKGGNRRQFRGRRGGPAKGMRGGEHAPLCRGGCPKI